MVPQTRAREARIRGQVAQPWAAAQSAGTATAAHPNALPPQYLAGSAPGGCAERRAYDRIVLGMDPAAAAQGVSPFAGTRIAPRASGLFGVMWC